MDPWAPRRFTNFLHESVLAWRKALPDEPRVADVGNLITEVLKLCEQFHCRPQPMADRSKFFPICAPGLSVDAGPHGKFLQALVSSLNHLYGCKGTTRGNPTSFRAMKRLASVVRHSSFLGVSLPPLNFSEFFSVRQLDYAGDEVLVAKPVVWESIEASLPTEVGQLDIRDFCEGGVRYYIDHLEEFMVIPDTSTPLRIPKVMVSNEEWDTVAHGLVSRGLCRVMRKSSLFHVGSEPVLNGLFAVSKQEYVGHLEICRLIMNFETG